MESPDLKPTPPDDPALEAWLRSGTALPPLRDDGFSQRVIAALPPPRTQVSQRLWVCTTGAIAGLAVATVAIVRAGADPLTLPAFDSASSDLSVTLALPLAFVLAAVSLGYAFRHRWQQLLR
jgi:hypothetical protein